jgi:hypothetical protein
VVSALRSVVTVLDRVSSRVLGLDGAVRNVRGQLDDRTLELARVAALEQRLAAHSPAPVAASVAA